MEDDSLCELMLLPQMYVILGSLDSKDPCCTQGSSTATSASDTSIRSVTGSALRVVPLSSTSASLNQRRTDRVEHLQYMRHQRQNAYNATVHI